MRGTSVAAFFPILVGADLARAPTRDTAVLSFSALVPLSDLTTVEVMRVLKSETSEDAMRTAKEYEIRSVSQGAKRG